MGGLDVVSRCSSAGARISWHFPCLPGAL